MQLDTYGESFYFSLCQKDEVARIFNVSNAEDYLLKLRANATIEHVRIHRVFLARMRRRGEHWRFSDYFDTAPFINYKNYLPDADSSEAEKLTAGFVFCESPNGKIIKTEFGNIITISESLRYFLYYMNLAFLDFGKTQIPGDVKAAAIKIAIRTMLQTEALDFDIDPRGKIPTSIRDDLSYHTDRQLEFVIGHEYAHHFLGHLNENNLIEDSFLSAIDSTEVKHKFYSYAQKEEFAADIDAIKRPTYTSDIRCDILTRALFFFVYIDIYEDVKNQISPSLGKINSHPSPMDRFNNLREYFKECESLLGNNLNNLLAWRVKYKSSLLEDVALNPDSYEFYGSIYLGQWRGKVLVDRVDF